MAIAGPDSDLLFRFTRPGHAELIRIGEIAAELPFEQDAPRSKRFGRALLSDSPLNDVIAKLGDILQHDYAENIAEQPFVPYAFDYVVMGDAWQNGTLSILTRLFDKARRANLANTFHGPALGRSGPDSYTLWAKATDS